MGTPTYLSMVRFSDMVVTPQEITMPTAVRPRIVMLWVFFLITVVVVGPSVPASAFVSCTWHHSQLPGELPETVTDEALTARATDIRKIQFRIPRTSNHTTDAEISTAVSSQVSGPIGRFPDGITLRGPPASH